jgi:FkbM family methyltransferase
VKPYNARWLRRNWRGARRALAHRPIGVIDIGARGGAPDELRPLFPDIDYVFFDADAQAVNAVASTPYRSSRGFPVFVGAREGTMPFHLCEEPGESSGLVPNPRFSERFKPALRVVRDVTVTSTTLDGFLASHPEITADVLKLDTQGTELDILTASPRALSSALLVECEVEFVEMYTKQPLMWDVAQEMQRAGFELLYLNRVFGTRHAFGGHSRGQLIFGDGLWGMSEERAQALPLDRKTKYVVLLLLYGHVDFAAALWSADAALRAACPDLAPYFRTSSADHFMRSLGRELDKVIAFLLSLRGRNQRRWDSDRSWPIR